MTKNVTVLEILNLVFEPRLMFQVNWFQPSWRLKWQLTNAFVDGRCGFEFGFDRWVDFDAVRVVRLLCAFLNVVRKRGRREQNKRITTFFLSIITRSHSESSKNFLNLQVNYFYN